MPIPGTGAGVAQGTLEQAILNAQNEISRLLSQGIPEGSLSIRNARQALRVAQQAFRAATGSQQGINLTGGGGGLFAFGLPNTVPGYTSQEAQAAILKPDLGEPLGLQNQGILGQLFARAIPSLFGSQQPTQEQTFNIRDQEQGPVPSSPAALDRHVTSRPFFPMGVGITPTATKPKPVQTKSVPKRRPRRAPGRRI